MKTFEVIASQWFHSEVSYLVDADTAAAAAAAVMSTDCDYEDYEKTGTDDIYGHVIGITDLETEQSVDPTELNAINQNQSDPLWKIDGSLTVVSEVTVIKHLTATVWIEIKLTSEGVIMDVWQDDECVATSSQMYDEIAGELAGDDIFDEDD